MMQRLSSLRSDIPPEAEGVKENKMSGLRPRHFLFRGMIKGLSSLRSDLPPKKNKHFYLSMGEGIVLASLGHPGVGRQGK
jgi:hypothetical protein